LLRQFISQRFPALQTALASNLGEVARYSIAERLFCFPQSSLFGDGLTMASCLRSFSGFFLERFMHLAIANDNEYSTTRASGYRKKFVPSETPLPSRRL
jgi:hypothetical protein